LPSGSADGSCTCTGLAMQPSLGRQSQFKLFKSALAVAYSKLVFAVVSGGLGHLGWLGRLAGFPSPRRFGCLGGRPYCFLTDTVQVLSWMVGLLILGESEVSIYFLFAMCEPTGIASSLCHLSRVSISLPWRNISLECLGVARWRWWFPFWGLVACGRLCLCLLVCLGACRAVGSFSMPA